MPTAKECRLHAETCLSLARESWEIYVKMALIELAKEFRAMANTWSEKKPSHPLSGERRRTQRIE
jgi:hypothetical protein